MSNVISLNTNNKSIFIDTNELFDINALNSLKDIVINRSIKTNNFTLGIYKYIGEEKNVSIICSYKGDLLFDDSFLIDTTINYDEFTSDSYNKLKNLLIIK